MKKSTIRILAGAWVLLAGCMAIGVVYVMNM